MQIAVGDRKVTPHGIAQTVDLEVAGSVPPGRHNILLTIHTDDPETPVVRVPMRVEHRAANNETN